jgi:hypothetical protein
MCAAQFPNLTPSKLPALSCLKRFKAEHVDKAITKNFSQAMAYGGLIHETLQWTFNPACSTPPSARDINIFARRAAYRQSYPQPELRDADIARCVRTVRAYVDQDLDANATVGVELFESITVSGGSVRPLTLGAKFDRILARPNAPSHLLIRDYKTGSPGPVDLESACLTLAIATIRFKRYSEFSVEYDYLNGHGLQERKIVTLEEAKPVWPELKARALRVYSAVEFYAEPGEHCTWCPLRAECRPNLEVNMDELDGVFG